MLQTLGDVNVSEIVEVLEDKVTFTFLYTHGPVQLIELTIKPSL